MGGIYFYGHVWDLGMYRIYDKIGQNPVGRVIIDQIKATNRDLTFMPRDGADIAVRGACNLETFHLNTLDAAPKGVGPRGNTPLYDETGRPVSFQVLGNRLGTGKGSDVNIHFDPEAYANSRCERQGPGSLPDEVLVHEMVHALRAMLGELNPVPVPNNPDPFLYDHDEYDTEEEFLAIVVANVYISAKGGTRFRSGHHGFYLLKPPLNTSAGFLSDPVHNSLMNSYRMIWSPIFTKLSVVPTQFNPFRELALNLPILGVFKNAMGLR